MIFNPITVIDGYKLDHRRQYPDGTTNVYSNLTPRSSRVPGVNKVVLFGLQAAIQSRLIDDMSDFFHAPREAVLERYARRVNAYLGPNSIGTDHIAALHDLGYLPLRICAVPEGTEVPLRVPMFTIEATHPNFAWLVNYFETILSAEVWMPCTSATTALRYRRLLMQAARDTGGDAAFVDWQGHDFSFRGMPGLHAAAMSGAAHLLSFHGTDTIPALDWIERYYVVAPLPENYVLGGSVAATEHSVMCAGGEQGELETFRRLLALYPTGIVSVVSDTWDFWHVVTEILPTLSDEIMARDGKLVIRPDSGDPVKIICGDPEADAGSAARMGLIETLYLIFGGTLTPQGYEQLDPHIGAIYGDSITPERAQAILDGLKAKGFASTNIVFGIGSYTYQCVTRDTFGFAMKATHVEVDGVGRAIYKAPKTDDGAKNSARGRLAVVERDGEMELIENAAREQEATSLLQPIWENSEWLRRESFIAVRDRVRSAAEK